MWSYFLNFLKENQIGDLTGVLGLMISIFGFGATIIGTFKSKASSERAEQAANDARDSIKRFDAIVDFTSAIAILDDIKRHQRQEQWVILLEKYASIRKILVSLRTLNKDLTNTQLTIIQSALANLSMIESSVEKGIKNPSSLKSNKFNTIISEDIDNLVSVLAEIKIANTGA